MYFAEINGAKIFSFSVQFNFYFPKFVHRGNKVLNLTIYTINDLIKLTI